MHKGYKCLDPAEGRVYISRDAVFDENVFPFSQLRPNAGVRLREEISLLPETLLNSPISSPGDIVFHDQHVSSPMPTNSLTSSTRSLGDAGGNADQNGVGSIKNGRYFMCDTPGGSPCTRVEEDTAAPVGYVDSAQDSAAPAHGGSALGSGSGGVSQTAGDSCLMHDSVDSRPAHAGSSTAGVGDSTLRSGAPMP